MVRFDRAECRTQDAEFLGHKFWARGYFVTTVGRDEEMIRAYIRNQESADRQLDQFELKISAAQNPIDRPKIP
jgi:REP element-mobilizing transposase RayT